MPGTTARVRPAPLPDDTAWPPVTVIVPTRNRPELVRESIAAVVGQDYPGKIECIVVHDQEPPDEELTRLGTAAAHGTRGRQHPFARPGRRPQHWPGYRAR